MNTAARKRVCFAAVVAAGALLLGACSSDDSSSGDDTSTTAADSSSTTAKSGDATTTTSGESAEEKRFDEEIQQWLIDVGCYSGSVDGVVGPETDAAIVAFQTAEGLTPDGEVGSQTEKALQTAADAGTKVCGAEPASTTTTAKSGSTTTTAKSTTAPCTATAISAALGGAQITNYICSGGYAGGDDVVGGGSADATFILQSEGGEWVDVKDDVCGAASAGIPPSILAFCDAS